MLPYQLYRSQTGTAFYQHELLSENMLIHGFFTRKGGRSIGDFYGLNCSFNSGDLFEDVNYNRQTVKKSMNLKRCQLITLSQIHGSKAIIIDNDNCNSATQSSSDFKADGLVTRNKNILLGILSADCAPILMADNNAGVIGACHAGWRGAIAGIIENTVLEMCKIGATANNIRCVIGPAIAQQSYEVDFEFKRNMLDKNPLAIECFYPNNSTQKDNSINKFFFDLQKYCKIALKRACVNQFASINIDTYQNRKMFFSYRLSSHEGKSKYGRQISIIGIK